MTLKLTLWTCVFLAGWALLPLASAELAHAGVGPALRAFGLGAALLALCVWRMRQ